VTRRWHPVPVAAGLLLGAAAAVPAAARPGLALLGWPLLGAAAGFATSGST
jgi:hypothetical protein